MPSMPLYFWILLLAFVGLIIAYFVVHNRRPED
jgi:hypothetical protein